MRFQLVNSMLLSCILFGIASTASVAIARDFLSSTLDNSVAPAKFGGEASELNTESIDFKDDGPLKKRQVPPITPFTPASPPYSRSSSSGSLARSLSRSLSQQEGQDGIYCGKTFYEIEYVYSVTIRACNELKAKQANGPPKGIRGKLQSCRVDIPYCNVNYPMLYKGESKDFLTTGPLYLWPIFPLGRGRKRKALGLKGNDRVVFDLSATCTIHGLARRKWVGKYWKPQFVKCIN